MDRQTVVFDALIGNSVRPEAIHRAADVLRRGGLVAFPTETVYGLGANALDARAVRAVFEAKGRPADNPLIVHIPRLRNLDGVIRPGWLTSPDGNIVLEAAWKFWPGPITFVVPADPSLPREVTAGLDTVAVRIPDHPVARALLDVSGLPIAAPSANRSGRPSPTTAQHVLDDLGGRIDLILDGGPTGVGVESTVVDATVRPPVLLRPGGLPVEALSAVIGEVRIPARYALADGAEGWLDEAAPRSPGLKHQHYAPNCPLWLVEGAPEMVVARILALTEEALAAGRRVGWLASRETLARALQASEGATGGAPAVDGGIIPADLGPRDDPQEAAQVLFRRLRELEAAGVDLILAEAPRADGFGRAVLDRLRRAAARTVTTGGEGISRHGFRAED